MNNRQKPWTLNNLSICFVSHLTRCVKATHFIFYEHFIYKSHKYHCQYGGMTNCVTIDTHRLYLFKNVHTKRKTLFITLDVLESHHFYETAYFYVFLLFLSIFATFLNWTRHTEKWAVDTSAMLCWFIFKGHQLPINNPRWTRKALNWRLVTF